MTAPNQQTLGVTTVGSAGAATGSGSFSRKIRGKLKSIDINYHASAPATTVVDVTYVGPAGNTITIVSVPAGNTDLTLFPKRAVHDEAGAPIDGLAEDWEFEDWTSITVTVTLSDALTNAVVAGITSERENEQVFWDGVYKP